MDYDDKKAEYERSKEKAGKINKVFTLIYYITIIPAALTLLIDIITIVVGTVTIGLVNYLTPKGIILLIINAVLVFFCIDAQDSKEKLKILAVIGILIIKMIVIGLPPTLISYLSLICIVCWIYAYRISSQWDYIKGEEGFPDFNTAYIKDNHAIENTMGSDFDDTDNKSEDTPSEMEELEVPEEIYPNDNKK